MRALAFVVLALVVVVVGAYVIPKVVLWVTRDVKDDPDSW